MMRATHQREGGEMTTKQQTASRYLRAAAWAAAAAAWAAAAAAWAAWAARAAAVAEGM